MRTDHDRRRDREYARRVRERQWIEAARGSRICPRRTCRGGLVDEVDALGRARMRCPQCERRLAGICRDCRQPVHGTIGKATRCAVHQREALASALKRSEARHREERRARERKRFKTDPTFREKRRAYARAWRERNPEKVRFWKRREALKQDPNRLAYFREYNAARAEQKRQHARAAYYRAHPERPTPVCRDCGASIPWVPPGRPPVRCNACVPAHVRNKRRRVLGQVVAA